MSPSHHHHGIVRGNPVQIAPQRESLFLQLGLVPIGIGDNESSRFGLPDTDRDRLEQFLEGAHTGKIQARPPSRRVQMVVSQAGNDASAPQIDLAGAGSSQLFHLLVGTQGQDPSIGDGDGLLMGKIPVYGDDPAIEQNRFRHRLCGYQKGIPQTCKENDS